MPIYKNHALKEFRKAGWMNDDGEYIDDMQELICKQVLGLLELFEAHGHSGFSASYAILLFSKLAAFETLIPGTGGKES